MHLESPPTTDELIARLAREDLVAALGVSPSLSDRERYLHWDKLRRLPTPVGLSSEQCELGSAEIGGRVSHGQQLIVVVQIGNVWTTANFKETQLRKMHVGQHVTIEVDSLDESFDGEVEYMPAATGDRSSLFPPENATGNYVKIVQRLPVRIRFNPNQRDLDKLRPGMSVEPKVHLD